MPYLKLTTNAELANKHVGLLAKLSKMMASETGKPESYVMVQVDQCQSMCFAGSAEPTAYLECKSIGLSPAQAKSLSSAISRILADELGVEAKRVYIEFSNCPGNFWGWNGSTF